jgi:hypothetical protein
MFGSLTFVHPEELHQNGSHLFALGVNLFN